MPPRNAPGPLWKGRIPSQSKARAGKDYAVTIWADGQATCGCYDYIFQGLRGPLGPNHRCGHIKLAISQQGVDIPTLATAPVPIEEPVAPPTPPVVEEPPIFEDDYFERVVRRPSRKGQTDE